MIFVYGSWRFTVYHFLVGPLLAMLLTSNPNEVAAIWCLLSIGILLLVVKTPIKTLHVREVLVVMAKKNRSNAKRCLISFSMRGGEGLDGHVRQVLGCAPKRLHFIGARTNLYLCKRTEKPAKFIPITETLGISV